MDSLLFEDSRKTQSVFQEVKIQLQHRKILILGVVVRRGQVQMEMDKSKNRRLLLAQKKWKASWGLQISTDSLSRTLVIW